MDQQTNLINILLCEDNLGDVFIIRNAFNSLNDSYISYEITHVDNGEKCSNLLFRREEYINAIRPNLIILDLNLPKKHGLEILKEIKEDNNLKRIPVIILTTSTAENDIIKSYNLYASCYIHKPFDFNEFTDTIKSLKSFWLKFVKLPSDIDNIELSNI